MKSVGIPFSKGRNGIVDLSNGEEKEVENSQLQYGSQISHVVMQARESKHFLVSGGNIPDV